jgi:hypothetical protein
MARDAESFLAGALLRQRLMVEIGFCVSVAALMGAALLAACLVGEGDPASP